MRESRKARAMHCANIAYGGWCMSYPEGSRRVCPIIKPFKDEYLDAMVDYCPFRGIYGYHVLDNKKEKRND